jgi:predicted O-methyltransferase YrrM
MHELEARDADERARGLSSPQRVRNVRPEVGKFLSLLIRATRARRILEVGTSNGYSTLWLGLAAQATDGQVTTLEHRADRAAEATDNFRRAGLSNVITIRQGDARQLLAELPGSFDFIFIDAEKVDYVTYLETVAGANGGSPLLADGGLIDADNVTSHPQETAAYVERSHNLPGLVSVTVPIGRGEQLSVKTRHPPRAEALATLKALEELPNRSRMLNIPHDAGGLLHLLVQAVRPKRVLEVGTSNGYSGIWLASALQAVGGRLTTIEHDSAKVNLARANFRRANVADVVDIQIGDASRVLRKLEGSFDLVFFDATKSDQLDNLKLVWDRISPGSLIVSDNTLTHVQELVSYTAYVRSHPQMDSLLVPIGNGFEMTLKA